MNAKDLAEAMISGELNYTPEDDASSIAKSYLKLAEFVVNVFDEYNGTGHLSTKTCLKGGFLLSEDPAKPIL